MNSPAHLIIALRKANKTLNDLFDIGQGQSYIRRKHVCVRLTKQEIEEINMLAYEQTRQRNCSICGVQCLKSKFMLGTCSQDCYVQKAAARNAEISKTHWTHSDNANSVCEKRIATRKQNDILLERKYVPWNKGKTGIYSAETIRKISNAALLQFQSGSFKKTNIEKIYEDVLKTLGIRYTYSYIFHRRQFDFFLHDYGVFVETHGDFWHGNPNTWGNTKPLREHQKMKRLDDFVKKALVEKAGYRYLEFWETDITKNLDIVIELTKEFLK